jgi:hypothetical protein
MTSTGTKTRVSRLRLDALVSKTRLPDCMNRLPSVPERLSRNVAHLPIWSFFIDFFFDWYPYCRPTSAACLSSGVQISRETN